MIGTFLTFFLSTSAYSATLVIENGQLVGADDIVFDGYTGNVRFVDGTCVDLFDGCDEPSDIVFETLTSTNTEAKDLALAANSALLAQVFDANPLYDTDIALTFGCEAGTFVALVYCGIITPYDYTDNNSVVTVSVTNRDDSSGLDTIGWGQGYVSTDSTIPLNPGTPDRLVYANWALTPTPIPLPAAGPLVVPVNTCPYPPLKITVPLRGTKIPVPVFLQLSSTEIL